MCQIRPPTVNHFVIITDEFSEITVNIYKENDSVELFILCESPSGKIIGKDADGNSIEITQDRTSISELKASFIMPNKSVHVYVDQNRPPLVT